MRVSYRPLIVTAQRIVLCLLLVPVLVPAVQAGNNSFISDAPMGKFTDEDIKLMNANIEATLADSKVRVMQAWSNPKTQHSGTAEILQAFAGPNGIPCKRVSVANRAGNLKGKSQYTLCKMDGKGWTYVPKDFASPPSANSNK